MRVLLRSKTGKKRALPPPPSRTGHDLLAASQTGLSQLLQTLAPPIAEHEVLSIVLSADLAGYDGLEAVVYGALARILEQVEGGALVVRRPGPRTAEAERAAREGRRELFAVEGWQKAFELAEVPSPPPSLPSPRLAALTMPAY